MPNNNKDENNVAPNSEMLATNATFLAEAEELWANNRTGKNFPNIMKQWQSKYPLGEYLTIAR